MKSYEDFFATQAAPEPPEGLAERILVRIAQRERRMLVAKIAATAAVFVASLAATWMGFADFQANIAQTGFLQFASLLFSNFSSITANLPDFALSMIEAFPAFSAAATLTGAGFVVWSVAAMHDELTVAGRKHLLSIHS